MATHDPSSIPLGDNDQAIITCRAGVGRAGACRANAGTDVSMLVVNPGQTDHGTFRFQREYPTAPVWTMEES